MLSDDDLPEPAERAALPVATGRRICRFHSERQESQFCRLWLRWICPSKASGSPVNGSLNASPAKRSAPRIHA